MKSLFQKKLDGAIFLDSFHNANHVEKIFYHYYPMVKQDGYFVIDDINRMLYSKTQEIILIQKQIITKAFLKF